MKKVTLSNFRLILMLIAIVVISSACIDDSLTDQTTNTISPLTINEIKNSSLSLPYDDLFRYNENYIGVIVYYRGEVLQVSEVRGDHYKLRVATGESDWLGYIDDVIFVDYSGTRLLEGDIIDVWGTVEGLYTYEAILGNSITIPSIKSSHTELIRIKDEQDSSINVQNNEITQVQNPEPTPTFYSEIYTENDVDTIMGNWNKSLTERDINVFLIPYSEQTSRNGYLINTPYSSAILFLYNAQVNYDVISRHDIESILQSNRLFAEIQLKTNEPYYTWLDSDKVRLLMKEGNNIYRFENVQVNSEIAEVSLTEITYLTSITGEMFEFDKIYDKKVNLITVIDGKETKFDIDLDKLD